MQGKVTGIGGIFFKTEDPKKTKQWYADALGIEMDKYGHSFTWRFDHAPHLRGLTQWSPMEASTDYYAPSKEPFMINYRVDDLDALLARCKDMGIQQIGKIESFDYGRFAWILDPDGRKIELWEAIDEPLL
jgi:predicted enzyme related to lactoylglutathione lyase